MAKAANQPEVCQDKSCHGGHHAEERVAMAQALCEQRGVRLTTARKQVLELLWQAGKPTGAYELIESLRKLTQKQIAPPTVYRALDFLMEQGLVSKIESQNAYVPCGHPERPHDCLFFLCRLCGHSVEMEDANIARRLSADAESLGFQVIRHTVEVEGLCKDCSEVEAAP